MIFADTNVISEAMGEEPDARVIRWVDAQPTGGMTTTAISLAEILHGIERLPNGRRKRELAARFQIFFERGLGGYAAPFDEAAAHAYAGGLAGRQKSGKPTAKLDAMIAAIAISQGTGLATRNIADFAGCGIALVNPWDAEL